MNTGELIQLLRDEQIRTWFDLGMFLDRFRENKAYPPIELTENFDEYKEKLRLKGVAFITFHYMVDGVTVEVNKYASLFRRSIPGIPVHLLAGNIHDKTSGILDDSYQRHVIPGLAGFDEWSLYKDLFYCRLERGSKRYNELILELWEQSLALVEELGHYVEENKIGMLYLVNICSNPGNVAAALACVLVSEYLGIPVINNNHDFYWEGGMCPSEREKRGQKAGPRDFFFTNCHLGEVFSIIEVLYPWNSRSWINVNINRDQSKHLIQVKGLNPSNVLEIGTAVDTSEYSKNDKRRNINTILQVEQMLSGYGSTLRSFSSEDVLDLKLLAGKKQEPILIGAQSGKVDRFISENIILLQPTRIISRKRIETSFNLLLKIFEQEEMILRFSKTTRLKMTLLITGPIAAGHDQYFRKLIHRFGELLEQAGELKDRIYLAFLFGELDKDDFKDRFEHAASIADMYNIASLILLPSATEGRGLPIIEATACGTPIFCRRYEPETVYAEVIGEHLEENRRLKVLEFKGKKISNTVVEKIIDRIFFPHRFTEEFRHNRKVVHQRYSLDALHHNLHEILVSLHRQLEGNGRIERTVREVLDDYLEMVHFSNTDLEAMLDTSHRHYLPGYGRLGFMIMLKSLIDPSYFRVEEQMIRGMAFNYATEVIEKDPEAAFISGDQIRNFYNAVETTFVLKEGQHRIQHDHSMSYRHRNRKRYPYQDFTFQELTGLINLLYIKIVQPYPLNKVDLSPQFFTDWNLALLQLTGSSYPAIDNRKKLIERLKSNLPIAYFPGGYIMYELEFFALQSIRSRLRLPLEKTISREVLEEEASWIKPVYIFAQEINLGKQLNKDEVTDYILNGKSEELRLLYEYKLLRIVRTKQVCVGIHFPQLGSKALKILRQIKEEKGYILTNRSNAAMMTDMVNMDRFHIGKVISSFASSIMGIPVGSGYIQFVPAGVRSTLSYPAPVQTAKDFDRALKSQLFVSLKKSMGEGKVMEAIREDALRRGSPVRHVLRSLASQENGSRRVNYQYISGLHKDGLPYNGALARIRTSVKEWDFAASSGEQPKTVLQFVKEFNKKSGHKAELAWNGGYILNPELVGKLGLSEAYIGSPLGLLVSQGKVLCPPLFNKAALLIGSDGKIRIQRVSCEGGLVIGHENARFQFDPGMRNRSEAGEKAAFYDLMFSGKTVRGAARTFVRLAGRKVKEILVSKEEEKVGLIPVGLTLAFDPGHFPAWIKEGMDLDIELPAFRGIVHAIEAGPLLLDEGRESIDMETEGWLTNSSIQTQAARLDYLDMRGPKIAVGTNRKGDLVVLTINGRIRESVGATHGDMADILGREGMDSAMGFDPGGSSTLVVGEETLNISPYNLDYMYQPYALAPEPRAVSNAIIAYLK